MNAAEIVDILLVEDNPHEAELVMRALRRSRPGVRVGLVHDGVEALDYVFGEGKHEGRGPVEPPRVILLDLKLPKVDGLEVLRRIKSDKLARTIPVVMLTSSREQRDIDTSYRLGANSYVVKPVNYEQLASLVQDLGSYWLAVNQGSKSEG